MEGDAVTERLQGPVAQHLPRLSQGLQQVNHFWTGTGAPRVWRRSHRSCHMSWTGKVRLSISERT